MTIYYTMYNIYFINVYSWEQSLTGILRKALREYAYSVWIEENTDQK